MALSVIATGLTIQISHLFPLLPSRGHYVCGPRSGNTIWQTTPGQQPCASFRPEYFKHGLNIETFKKNTRKGGKPHAMEINKLKPGCIVWFTTKVVSQYLEKNPEFITVKLSWNGMKLISRGLKQCQQPGYELWGRSPSSPERGYVGCNRDILEAEHAVCLVVWNRRTRDKRSKAWLPKSLPFVPTALIHVRFKKRTKVSTYAAQRAWVKRVACCRRGMDPTKNLWKKRELFHK